MSYAVLICDDDQTCRAALHTLLHGHDVVAVGSDNAALDELEKRSFDAIVTTGVDLLWFVRSAYPALIRFLVSSEELEVVVKAVNDGAAHRFFQKPCDAEKLRDALEIDLRARLPGASRD